MAYKQSRIRQLAAAIFLCCLLLGARLAYLQLLEGPRLTVLSLGGRIQEVPVEVARGEILDRNGQLLTNTTQHFSLVVFPAQVEDAAATAAALTALAGQTPQSIAARISQESRPIKLKSDIDAMTAQKINACNLPGVVAVAEKVRYGYSSLGAHIVGYINQADNRGVSGIEKMYDNILRGSQALYLAAIVDAGQQIIPGLGYKRIKLSDGAGPSNIVLTIDSRIQKITEKIMDEEVRKGAVVVMRPSTGEILAMASRPNFDGNNLDRYLKNSAAPLLNRALAAYQPGSVFKLMVAAAALEEKLVRPDDVFFDPGYIDVNNLRFKAWDYEKGARGRLTFTEALAHSSNPVFIEVGLRLGAEKLISYARKFGFGHKTSLEFDGEADGNLPAAAALYPGDVANLSIGQGMLEATPLQIASLVATIVNDGVKVDPYIVSKLTNQEGVVVKNFPASRGSRVLSRQSALRLQEMMSAVTASGTGRAAYVEAGGSAGKTGTAETGRTGAGGRGINHAWFAGYAPLDNPQYVVVVFVEDGMSGGDVAAPVFREVLSRLMAAQPDK